MKIKLKKYKKVKSTNDIALRLIKKNNTYPVLVTSKEQTNGRGRMGKKVDFSKRQSFYFFIFLSLIKKKLILNSLQRLMHFYLKK